MAAEGKKCFFIDKVCKLIRCSKKRAVCKCNYCLSSYLLRHMGYLLTKFCGAIATLLLLEIFIILLKSSKLSLHAHSMKVHS